MALGLLTMLGASVVHATPFGGRGFTFGFDVGPMLEHQLRRVTQLVVIQPDSAGFPFLDPTGIEDRGITRGGASLQCQLGYGTPRAWRIQYSASADVDVSRLGAARTGGHVVTLTTHVLGVELYPQNAARIPWFLITGLGVGSMAQGRSGAAVQFGAGVELAPSWRVRLVGQSTRIDDRLVWSARLQIGLHRD